MSVLETQSGYNSLSELTSNSYLVPRLTDILSRLKELRSLQSGWLNGNGNKLNSEGIIWLELFFEKIFPEDISLPYLYPTVEGGIQAEWPGKASLEIDLSNYRAELCCFAEDIDLSLDLDNTNDQHVLFKKIRDM